MLGSKEILDLREQTAEQLIDKLFALFRTEDILTRPYEGLALCSLIELKGMGERLLCYDSLTAKLAQAIEREEYELAAEILPKVRYFSKFFLADVPEARR
jgi:hypothetical protein